MADTKRHPDFPDEEPSHGPANEPPPVSGVVSVEEWNGIGNEFTGVLFRKVRTNNGERLQLFVPKRGYSALLDPMQLEIVAAQDPEAFSELHARQLGASNRPTEPNDAGTSDESAAGDLNGSH
jgi:hypothetical protein